MSLRKCTFCELNQPICRHTTPRGIRVGVCSSCVAQLLEFAEMALRARAQTGRPSTEQLSQADRLRQPPRKRRGMSPDELARSLAATAAKQRELTLRQMRPKVVELSLGSILSKDDLRPVPHKRIVQQGRLRLNDAAVAYVERATAGAVGGNGPARRPA
jgi:hypothetical protein